LNCAVGRFLDIIAYLKTTQICTIALKAWRFQEKGEEIQKYFTVI